MIKDDEVTQFMDDVAALIYLKGNKFKSAGTRAIEVEIKERLEDRGCRVVVKLLAQRKYDKLVSEKKLMEMLYPDLES